MGYFSNLFNIILKPKNTFNKNKGLTITSAFMHLLLGLIIFVFGRIIYNIILYTLKIFIIILDGGSPAYALSFYLPNIIGSMVGVVFNVIFAVVGAWLFFGTINWLITKIFGNKKGIVEFISFYGLFLGALYSVLWIPIIGLIFALYFIYIYYRMLTEAMQMKSGSAILAIVILAILVIILSIIFIGILIALIALFGFGSYTAMSLY